MKFTRASSLLKVTLVQLNRLGGSQPLCSSQWRIAVPIERKRESSREEQIAAEKVPQASYIRCHYYIIIRW